MKQLVRIIRVSGGVEIQHSSTVKGGHTTWVAEFPHEHWVSHDIVQKKQVGVLQEQDGCIPTHIYLSTTEFERDPLKYIDMVRGIAAKEEQELSNE